MMPSLIKLCALSAMACLMGAAHAEDAKGHEGMDFPKHKEMMLKHVDAHIALLQEKKACVSAANAAEDLRKCHDAAEQKENEMRSQHEAMRAQHIDEKIKRLQERKERLEKKAK